MSKIILLVVGAAWAAVLLPPLLRSRVDNRPSSSVVDFRRQLSTLQRTVPNRGMAPMRSMARPLAPSPRPGARVHHNQEHLARSGSLQHPLHLERTTQPERTWQQGPRAHHQQAHIHPGVSARELARQRRQNVLFTLVAVTIGAAFLAFTTKSSLLTYVFVLAAISLVGYCYKLAQLKRAGQSRPYGEHWFHAA